MRKGQIMTEEQKMKISENRKKLIKEGKIKMSGKNNHFYGKKHSEESKRLMSEARKGKCCGKNNPNYGKTLSEEQKIIISEVQKGNKNRLGCKNTEEHRRKISEAHKGKKLSEEHRKKISESKIGNKNALGFKHSEETRRKESEARKGIKLSQEAKNNISEAKKGEKNPMYGTTGIKCPSWKGGKSFEPYGLEFNNKLKNQIRERDNFECQECHQTQEKIEYKLPVHHIDYDKTNNKPENLISLCKSCHSQTNFGRVEWIKYFKGMVA